MDELNKKKLYENIKDSAVIQFSAAWCAPCKVMTKNIESMSDNLNAIFFKVYVDKYPELSSEFSIKALPTLISFKDGKESGRLIGVRTKEQILEFVK